MLELLAILSVGVVGYAYLDRTDWRQYTLSDEDYERLEKHLGN